MKNVLAPIAIVAALAGCRKAENDSAAEARIPVKVAIAQMQPISETIGAIGSVAARPGFVASLTAPAQARRRRCSMYLLRAKRAIRAAKVKRPVSVQLRELRREARQRARRAETGHPRGRLEPPGSTLSRLPDCQTARPQRYTSGWSAGLAKWAWPALGALSRAK